jgi:hypothetical protein
MHDSPPCVKASKAFGLGASFGLGALAVPGLLSSRAPSRKPRTAASLVLAAALAALGLLCPGTGAQTAINTAPAPEQTIFTLATSYIDTPMSYAETHAATYGSNIDDWSPAAVSNIHRPNFCAPSTRNTDGRQQAVRAGDELQPRAYRRRLGLDWQWQVHDGGRLRLHEQHDWCVLPRLGGPICGLPFYNDE